MFKNEDSPEICVRENTNTQHSSQKNTNTSTNIKITTYIQH
jgi:hypothetical protein